MLRPFQLQNRGTFCWTLSWQLFFALALLPFQSLVAQQPLEVEFNLFNLPSCRQTLIALNSPAIANFEKRPLGECLKTLGIDYRVAIWVDRRVDLSRLVSIAGVSNNESLEAKTTLGRLAAVARLGGADAGPVENIVYVGPSDQIAAVQRSAVRLHNEIMTTRKGVANGEKVELKTLSWEDITTPTELLENIQKRWAIKVESKLPHDLMHAGELPSSTLATQLTLLHAGFNQEVECDSRGVFSTRPLVQESNWRTEYADRELQLDRAASARKDFPKATLQAKGKTSIVTGPTAFHLRLLAIRGPNQRGPNARNPNSRPTEPVFTLNEVRGPLERVINGLGQNLGMEVKWSKEIPDSKKQAVVTFGVTKAKTADEILKQLADESGLKIQRQQQTIEVSP